MADQLTAREQFARAAYALFGLPSTLRRATYTPFLLACALLACARLPPARIVHPAPSG
jgi:hypothetical protein